MDTGEETPTPKEFPDGDPRAGPFTAEEREESARFVRDPLRWHRTTGVDWLAVRLQHGRGFNQMELAHFFEIGDSTISRRMRAEKWQCPMAEIDRRKLARHVWLAGLQRIDPDDEASLAALKAASEWRMRVREPAWRWKPEGESKQTINVNRIEDDEHCIPDDPDFADAESFHRKLDAMLAELGAGGTVEVGEAEGDQGGESVPAGDGAADALCETEAGEAVGAAGEAGAASA